MYACAEAKGESETSAPISEEPYNSDYEFENGEHIHWEAETEGDYIVIKAWLNTDWNTYSVYNTNFLGPLPTLIFFDDNENFELVGEIEEVGLKSKFDKESESEIGYFENMAVFKQKIKPISGEEFALTGNVNYMICNSNMCLPPADYNFELTIKP